MSMCVVVFDGLQRLEPFLEVLGIFRLPLEATAVCNLSRNDFVNITLEVRRPLRLSTAFE